MDDKTPAQRAAHEAAMAPVLALMAQEIRAGGKPSKGTPADRRLGGNRPRPKPKGK
jgi:hypothetical protein